MRVLEGIVLLLYTVAVAFLFWACWGTIADKVSGTGNKQDNVATTPTNSTDDLQAQIDAIERSYHHYSFDEFSTAYSTLANIFENDPNAIIKISSNVRISGTVKTYSFITAGAVNGANTITCIPEEFVFIGKGYEYYLTLKAAVPASKCLILAYTFNGNLYELQITEDMIEVIGKKIREATTGMTIMQVDLPIGDVETLKQLTFDVFTNVD